GARSDAQAERRSRPLRRRAARMARPARVRMRNRKPWVFARRRLFGWKVRLLTEVLQTSCATAQRWEGHAGATLEGPAPTVRAARAAGQTRACASRAPSSTRHADADGRF